MPHSGREVEAGPRGQHHLLILFRCIWCVGKLRVSDTVYFHLLFPCSRVPVMRCAATNRMRQATLLQLPPLPNNIIISCCCTVAEQYRPCSWKVKSSIKSKCQSVTCPARDKNTSISPLLLPSTSIYPSSDYSWCMNPEHSYLCKVHPHVVRHGSYISVCKCLW